MAAVNICKAWKNPVRAGLSGSLVFQLLSQAQLFVTPRTTGHQASWSFTISWSLLRLMSIELVMPSNHLILRHPLLLNLSMEVYKFQRTAIAPGLCCFWSPHRHTRWVLDYHPACFSYPQDKTDPHSYSQQCGRGWDLEVAPLLSRCANSSPKLLKWTQIPGESWALKKMHTGDLAAGCCCPSGKGGQPRRTVRNSTFLAQNKTPPRVSVLLKTKNKFIINHNRRGTGSSMTIISSPFINEDSNY